MIRFLRWWATGRTLTFCDTCAALASFLWLAAIFGGDPWPVHLLCAAGSLGFAGFSMRLSWPDRPWAPRTYTRSDIW